MALVFTVVFRMENSSIEDEGSPDNHNTGHSQRFYTISHKMGQAQEPNAIVTTWVSHKDLI